MKGSPKNNKANSEYLKQREKMYVSHWNVEDKYNSYEPLRDSFSQYFFSKPSVKQHLRRYSKRVSKSPKTCDLKRMTFLVHEKYRQSNTSPQQKLNAQQQVRASYKNNHSSVSSIEKESKFVKNNRNQIKEKNLMHKLPQVNNHQTYYKSTKNIQDPRKYNKLLKSILQKHNIDNQEQRL